MSPLFEQLGEVYSASTEKTSSLCSLSNVGGIVLPQMNCCAMWNLIRECLKARGNLSVCEIVCEENS